MVRTPGSACALLALALVVAAGSPARADEAGAQRYERVRAALARSDVGLLLGDRIRDHTYPLLGSRLGGGIGTRGPGETKLEADRRRIRPIASGDDRDPGKTAPAVKRSRFLSPRGPEKRTRNASRTPSPRAKYTTGSVRCDIKQ